MQMQKSVANLTIHQQEKMEKAIITNCGALLRLNVLSQVENVVRVDQGIFDIYYTTVLEGFIPLDQGFSDRYIITVESVLADTYDHTNKDWGSYSVESVSCHIDQ